jgi:hypothetical protein
LPKTADQARTKPIHACVRGISRSDTADCNPLVLPQARSTWTLNGHLIKSRRRRQHAPTEVRSVHRQRIHMLDRTGYASPPTKAPKREGKAGPLSSPNLTPQSRLDARRTVGRPTLLFAVLTGSQVAGHDAASHSRPVGRTLIAADERACPTSGLGTVGPSTKTARSDRRNPNLRNQGRGLHPPYFLLTRSATGMSLAGQTHRRRSGRGVNDVIAQ